MIEAAREMLDLVKHMPEYTLWVLIGILFYKVVIIGGWISVARLLINKLHNFAVTPKVLPEPPVQKMDLGKLIVVYDACDELISTLDMVRRYSNEISYLKGGGVPTFQKSYLHRDDVAWMRKVLEEAALKHKQEITEAMSKAVGVNA